MGEIQSRRYLLVVLLLPGQIPVIKQVYQRIPPPVEGGCTCLPAA
jgi:hypothetical protein